MVLVVVVKNNIGNRGGDMLHLVGSSGGIGGTLTELLW